MESIHTLLSNQTDHILPGSGYNNKWVNNSSPLRLTGDVSGGPKTPAKEVVAADSQLSGGVNRRGRFEHSKDLMPVLLFYFNNSLKLFIIFIINREGVY